MGEVKDYIKEKIRKLDDDIVKKIYGIQKKKK